MALMLRKQNQALFGIPADDKVMLSAALLDAHLDASCLRSLVLDTRAMTCMQALM